MKWFLLSALGRLLLTAAVIATALAFIAMCFAQENPELFAKMVQFVFHH